MKYFKLLDGSVEANDMGVKPSTPGAVEISKAEFDSKLPAAPDFRTEYKNAVLAADKFAALAKILQI